MAGSRLWSTLASAPVELEIELSKVPLAEPDRDLWDDDLIADGMNVPGLKPRLERLQSKEAKLRVVLEYFGDRGQPQPEERTD